jgi:tetratricopeptide (TPR) repeat protein
MGRIKYTVTTTTKRCPHCGKIIDQKSEGELTPLYGIIFLFAFYILIPYWLIKYLAFKAPEVPSVGEKFMKCPHCSSPIMTNNVSIGELKSESLLNYKYRVWFWVCYSMGALCGSSLFFTLVSEASLNSVGGLISLLSLIGALAIIFAYRYQLSKCRQKAPQIVKKASPEPKCCSRCGAHLNADSKFCHKCGTEINPKPSDKGTPTYIDSIFDIEDSHVGKYVQLIGEYSWFLVKKEPLQCNISQYSVRGTRSVMVELAHPLPDYVINASSDKRQPIILRGILERSIGTYEKYVLKEAVLQDYWRDQVGRIICDKKACQQVCSKDCPIYLNNCGKDKYNEYSWSEAIALLKRAVFLAPDYSDAWRNLGYAHLNSQQYTDSYESFCEAEKNATNNEQTMHGKIISLAKIGRYKEAQDMLVKYQNLFPNKDSSNLTRIVSEELSKVEEKAAMTDNEYLKVFIEKGFDAFWKMVIEEKERTFTTKVCEYTGSAYAARCQQLQWFVSVDIDKKGQKLLHYRKTLIRDNINGAEKMILFNVIDEYERRYIKY